MDSSSLKIMGIIGARSGSKGTPGKNIKPLLGKPLMGWIIEAAKKSKYINRLVVSTDSEKYAEVARKFGAEIPCLRPKELAADLSPEFEYIKHMLKFLQEKEGYRPDIVVRLMATTPTQLPEDIDGCLEELFKDPEAHSSVVIAEARQHPQKALKIVDGSKRLVTFITGSGREVTPIARQNYEKAYFRANIIAARIQTIERYDSLTGDLVRYYIIPQERAIDIDSPTDFMFAETIINKFNKTL